MRRKEYIINDEFYEDVKQFLLDMAYGTLALNNTDGYPIVKALNYVYYNDAIYLHGSHAGEKMKALKEIQFATFSITEDFSFIPSYMEDIYFACPASTLYKSVVIKGSIAELEDEKEKHEVMDAFMKKLQPEGGYAPIKYEDTNYHKRVKATAVLKLTIEQLSHKYKFGQNWKEEKHSKVKHFLTERNKGLDHETVKLMERYCPYHKD